tara:strand:+ start:816 stop:1763 length:948 start_codon:yes stop_codon:yes gene_type:complete
MGYGMKIKILPEDFRVWEIGKLNTCEFSTISGRKYAYFLMKKKAWNTQNAVAMIAKRLRIKVKDIGYAGNKDKNAITEQYISIPLTSENSVSAVESLRMKDISIKFVGWGSERITLGNLEGNKFEIVVRDLDSKVNFSAEKVKNYFGEQRFGIEGSNVEIGKAMIKGNFKKACELLKLDVNGNDYVGSLKKIDNRMLKLYVSAYQSWLWNKVASDVVDGKWIEIVGFLSEFSDENVGKIYDSLLKSEGISKEDFIMKSFKEISPEGSKRTLYMDVKNFSYKWSDDELNKGMKKCKLAFELGSGSYATVFVRQLFR